MRAADIPTTPGQGEGEGRLVIRFHYYSAPLVSPEGWPPRLSPKPGETLVSLWDRDIVGDRFLLLVTARTTRAPVPPLDGRHPAELTFAWWEKEWPDRGTTRCGIYRRRVTTIAIGFIGALGWGCLASFVTAIW